MSRKHRYDGENNDTTPMARFGVTVVKKAAWPYPIVPGSGRNVFLRQDTKLCTTQGAVYNDHVTTKMKAIEAGQQPVVEIVRSGGRTWITDGHHTLAAYRRLGQRAPAFLYTIGAVGDRIEPPRLHSR